MHDNDDRSNNDNEMHIDGEEDTTKYGEFISSYFSWMTLERQKKNARKLENITKPEDEKQ